MPVVIATNTMPNGDTHYTVAKQFMRSGVSQDVVENTDGSSTSEKARKREEEGVKALFDDDEELCEYAPVPKDHDKRQEEMEALIEKLKTAKIDPRSKERLLGLLKNQKPPTHHGQFDALYFVSEKLKHLLEKTKKKAKEIASILEKRPREESDDEDEADDKTAAPKPKRMRRSSSESPLSESCKSESPKPLRRTVSVPTPSMCKVPKPAKLEKVVLETSA